MEALVQACPYRPEFYDDILLGLLLAGAGLIVWSLFRSARMRPRDPALWDVVEERLGAAQWTEAAETAEADATLAGRLLGAALVGGACTSEAAGERLSRASALELLRLEGRIRLLSWLAVLAPAIGSLGALRYFTHVIFEWQIGCHPITADDVAHISLSCLAAGFGCAIPLLIAAPLLRHFLLLRALRVRVDVARFLADSLPRNAGRGSGRCVGPTIPAPRSVEIFPAFWPTLASASSFVLVLLGTWGFSYPYGRTEAVTLPTAASAEEIEVLWPDRHRDTYNINHMAGTDRDDGPAACSGGCRNRSHWRIRKEGYDLTDSAELDRHLQAQAGWRRAVDGTSRNVEITALIRADAHAPFGLVQSLIFTLRKYGYGRVTFGTARPKGKTGAGER